MKRLILAMFLLGFGFASQAQVQDNAVIPISVTVNSVLRLQVNSGGNIQFVFNTMDQFTKGIHATANTTTKFTVSSSRKYEVEMNPEDAELKGISTGNGAPLELIRYKVTGNGTTSTNENALTINPTDPIVRSESPAQEAQYEISWSVGTVDAARATNLAPDTYITNVFLTLKAN